MTPDRKLVEEIGRRICPHGDAYYAGPCDDCAEGVAHMVEVLRIVQLPEEVVGWQYEVEEADGVVWDDMLPDRRRAADLARRCMGDDIDVMGRTTGRIRPLYPGDPQEVDDG